MIKNISFFVKFRMHSYAHDIHTGALVVKQLKGIRSKDEINSLIDSQDHKILQSKNWQISMLLFLILSITFNMIIAHINPLLRNYKKKCVSIVTAHLMSIFNIAMSYGSFSFRILEALIVSLPKPGKDPITCPIYLLNTG